MIENIIFGIIIIVFVVILILLKYYFSIEYYNKYFKVILSLFVLVVVMFLIFLIKFNSYNIIEDSKLLGKYNCEESNNPIFKSIVDKNTFVIKNNCQKKIDELNKIIYIEGEDIERVEIEEQQANNNGQQKPNEDVEISTVEKIFIVVDISDIYNIYLEDLKMHKEFIKKDGINFNNTFDNEEDALNYIFKNSIYVNDKNSNEYNLIANKIYYLDSENYLRLLSTNIFAYDKLKIKNYSKNLLINTNENEKNIEYLEIGKKLFCTNTKDITTQNFFISNVIVDKTDEYLIKNDEKFNKLQKRLMKDKPDLDDINEYIKWVNIYENSDTKLNYDMVLNNPINIEIVKVIKEQNLNTSTQTNVICKKRVLQQIFNKNIDDIKYLKKAEGEYFNYKANYCDKPKNYNYFHFNENENSKISDEIFKDFMLDNATRSEHGEEKQACIRRINMHYDDIIGSKTMYKKDYEEYKKHLLMCDDYEKVYIPLDPPKIKIIKKLVDDNKHFGNTIMRSLCIDRNTVASLGENYENVFDSQGNFNKDIYYNKFITALNSCRNFK